MDHGLTMGTIKGLEDMAGMVDMVAISEASRVLSIDSKMIKQIDVVNRPYIKGNITYGGIISIISRSGDFAGVDLPASGQFFDYKMFEPSSNRTCEHSKENNRHTPQPWNCLYWNASVHLLPGEHKKIQFTCGDTKGEYIVIIRGYNNHGKLISLHNTFEVK